MKVQDYLSKDEIRQLTTKSDLRGAWMVMANWLLIAGAFALAYRWPNPLTLVIAILILGGRQLGLSILVHECGHRSLFATRRLNEICGNWLAGYAVFLDMDKYAKGHLVHHRTAGTRDDPDLPNYRDYPVDKSSFYRKVWRDLSGQTAMKLIASLSQGGQDQRSHSSEHGKAHDSERNRKPNPVIRNSLIVNGVMLMLLAVFAHPALYLLWVVAYLTVYMLVLRIRQIAEHADVPDLYDLDPRKNTRTTYTNPLTRLLIAPNFVNYHLEHHILASVPAYHLKRLHHLLKQRGAYEDTPLGDGYWQIIRQVTRSEPQTTTG
ncbi:MAG: fatty acid desaturase family protein [Ketobacteraceae bacterium]|nr:fatty acid desaturase family protein [Ketobacteraceae bacterium]